MTPTTTPAQPEALRLAKYVARRKLAKQVHPNEIHGFDAGCETEAVLRLSDIEAVLAQVAALTAAPGVPLFDEQGFRDWVLRNMPDDTIIGSSAYWADHLTAWAKRFVTSAPAQPAEGAAYAEAPIPYGVSDDGYNVFRMKQMLDFADRTHALRASHEQAPAAPKLEELLVWAVEDGLMRMSDVFKLDLQDSLERFARRFAAPTAQPAPAAGAVAGPEGWITWWPTAPGVRDPVYTHGPEKPSHGPELDAVLRKYPVFAAAPTPAAQQGDALSEEVMCGLEAAANALEWIAKRERVVGDVIERVDDIRHASRLAAEGYRRIDLAMTAIDRAALAQEEGTHGN